MVPEGLRNLFVFLNRVGLMDVVLPFVIAFGLLYAIFEKTMVFGRNDNGEPKGKVNMIVAGVISLMFVVSLNLVNMMTTIVWVFSGLIMAVILGSIIAGVFGVSFGKKKEEGSTQNNNSRSNPTTTSQNVTPTGPALTPTNPATQPTIKPTSADLDKFQTDWDSSSPEEKQSFDPARKKGIEKLFKDAGRKVRW
jgi:flagellar basal body-associated protein FliL